MIKGILRVALMTVIAIVAVSCAFLGGYATSNQVLPGLSPATVTNAPADWQPYLPVFWEAWNFVHQDFYKPAFDDTSLAYGGVDGMVDALGDEHTVFLDAKKAAKARLGSSLQGSFEGIGATVEMREGRLYIVTPIEGSPAEKAGLLPNDIVIEVDGKIIQDMDVNQAVQLIRGPKGTPVTLKIQRAKQAPFMVTINRATIRTPLVQARMIEGTRFGYIHLTSFGDTTTDELQAALQMLINQKPAGLIFDLRRNLGGYYPVAIDVTSQFIKSGQTVVVVKDKDGNPYNVGETKSQPGGLVLDLPMVLLIDEFSASGSEIVAAAVKDYKRATLIGVKSFGKGSVQNVHQLNDKSELHVTVAHFFSPKGSEIDGIGITPDIEVKITEDDIVKRRDPQLDKAIEVMKSKTGLTSMIIPQSVFNPRELAIPL